MPNNEIEPVKKENTGIEQLIKLEKERSAAWIEILSKIKDELRKGSEFNLGRINNLENRIRELEDDISKSKNVITVFEGMSEQDKIKMLRERNIDIPSDKELNQLEIVGGIAKLFPEPIEIRVPEGVEKVCESREFLKNIEPLTIPETKDKLKKLSKELKELKERVDKPEPSFLLTEEWVIKELFNQGVTLLKNGKIQNAYEYFANIIELNSKIRSAWLNKGIIHGDAEEYEEEIHCYDEALKIDEKYAKAWYNKGIALEKLDKSDEANKCLDMAKEIDPELIGEFTEKEV